MFPILFHLGGFTVYSYGLFIAIGFLLGIGLALKGARQKGIPNEKILDLSFYIILSAILGARILYGLIHYPRYLEHPLDFFKVWEGGLVFYGGLILSFLTGFWFIRKQKLPFWETADLLAPSIAIGQVFGRLGCFAAGCCFGQETNRIWGVTFTHPDSLAPTGIALHPTQLYESLIALIIFFILWFLKDRPGFSGRILLYYLFLYGLGRWALEFFRGDNRGSLLGGGWSDTQYISIFLVFFSIIMARHLKNRKTRTS
ncbi:MAG: prolipoprotein diacylglyceryl transferase [Deltaproteobacteria bacterium RBG_13_43_22]|nr:MAG: prolipoprotein diacylglyceryl transferase [Deltaproteobacteria bacterium RBG_13_43_22]